MRIETLDLEFRATSQTIAAFLVFGAARPVLVETGPASTLPALERALAAHGVAVGDVAGVLVTHIHLDHAGAAGFWAARGTPVFVHPRGAPHLIDPGRLLASARRIYGEAMDELWGTVTPAPAARVHAVEDGETVELEGLGFRALATPGHAGHHHVFLLGDAAFTGDAAGIRIPGSAWLDLPAPPPEFDLGLWRASLARLRAARPKTIYRTHFDASPDVAAELDRVEALLDESVAFLARELAGDAPREEIVARYEAWVAKRARAAGTDDEALRRYEIANPRAMSVDGISRYLAHRDDAAIRQP